jgi:hypothetical protein
MPTVLYLPAATLLFEWFITRRGLATGIMFSGQSPRIAAPGLVQNLFRSFLGFRSGTGVGGFVFPFVMKALIEKFGYKVGMCCVVGLVLGSCTR